MSETYRFSFKDGISPKKIEETLFWAVFNAESVFGKPRIRLDASFLFDRDKKVCVIDKSTDVGRHIAQVFTNLLIREFGEEAFKVERISKENGTQ